MAEDLSSFAKHAGRKVANADDVYLYARKNKSMVSAHVGCFFSKLVLGRAIAKL